MRIGSCTTKHWSSTQKTVALSSGEAELYAMNRGISESIGMKSIAADYGESLAIVVLIDASATIGLTNRQGLGRARHIEVNELWAQQKLEDKVFVLKKVMGEHNHADILTKPKDHIALVNHMQAIGFVRKHAVNHLLGN